MTQRNRRPGPDLELHVMVDGQVVIRPVQATLLEAIRSKGSIAAAQRRIGASYAHVCKLVAAMNEAFSRRSLTRSVAVPAAAVLP